MLFRVAARCIIIDRGRLLVQLSRHGDFYRLPGGRIRPEETVLQGLQRELREELGIDHFDAPRLLYIVDSFYRRRNGIVHEIGFYFLCNGIDVSRIRPKEEHLRIKWIGVEDVSPDTMRPSSLAAYLRRLMENGGKVSDGVPVYLVNIDVGEE